MRVFIYITTAVFFICTFITPDIQAENNRKKYALGINYPGLALRYSFTDKLSLEARGYYIENITVIGLRTFYFFKPISSVHPFLGLEFDYIIFEGDVSQGNGMAIELLAGGEYFISKPLSLQLDIGPALIVLYDNDYDESTEGIEYVMNIGLNWYFGKKL